MANSFDSNITRQLARVFGEKFETARVLSKNVDTQLLNGRFNPTSGTVVDFKRPTSYKTKRSTGGDITGAGRSDIITGKASGTVQNYFTVDMEWNIVDEALKMDQLDQLIEPAATQIVTDLELDFAAFMMKNTGLLAGTVGTAASDWDHIANAGAVMTAHGVPMDSPWYYTVNPFTQVALAKKVTQLGAGGTAGNAILDAYQKATIMQAYAGFDRVMTSTAMATYTTFSDSDRAGTLSANPTVTYVGAKDTMTQSLPVTGFGANTVITAGETIKITGRYRLNLSTRRPVITAAGAKVEFTATVAETVTLNGSGAGTIVITGPAIYEANGAYNTVDSAPVSGDVVTLLGSNSTTIQPNMFWHKNAFAIGSVPIPKMYSTDTVATTKDGLQFRVSKYADGDANKQIVRFDFQPAYACLNPFLAGQGFGS